MKLITKVEFNEAEVLALQTLAKVGCGNLACDDCPFDRRQIINERTNDFISNGCLIDDIRNICDKHGIKYSEY